MSVSQRQAFESALDDIVLFGNAQEVAASLALMDNFATHQFADIDGLLLALRTHLRQELGLKRVDVDRVPTLRIDRGSDAS